MYQNIIIHNGHTGVENPPNIHRVLMHRSSKKPCVQNNPTDPHLFRCCPNAPHLRAGPKGCTPSAPSTASRAQEGRGGMHTQPEATSGGVWVRQMGPKGLGKSIRTPREPWRQTSRTREQNCWKVRIWRQPVLMPPWAWEWNGKRMQCDMGFRASDTKGAAHLLSDSPLHITQRRWQQLQHKWPQGCFFFFH